MRFSVHIPYLTSAYLISCSLLLRHHLSANATTTTTTSGVVSIGDTPDYRSQRDCVQSALWSGRNAGAGESNIVAWLGCTNNLDSCFCRADLASSASSLLTSGIISLCSSDTTDVASGIAVYNSYCSRAGPATVDTASTTSGSDSSTTTVTATQTVFTSTAPGTTLLTSTTPSGSSLARPGSPSTRSPVSPNTTSQPVSPTSSSSGSEGLSLSDRISLGVGLGVALPLGLIGVWLSFWMVLLMRRS